MMKNSVKTCLMTLTSCFMLAISGQVSAMGLRSFVALPIEKEGGVLRLSFEKNDTAETESLTLSAAYGISNHQALLLSAPYFFSSVEGRQTGDLSLLYRHTMWQSDRLSGTSRLSLLGGAIIPTEDTGDVGLQSGFVFTYFKNRHEIDIDALYQPGINQRRDSGRYDISWQYRLSPVQRPDWGIPQELQAVIELNGRWQQGDEISQQFTLGLQWVSQLWVIEGGVAKSLNRQNGLLYLLSTRFHF